MTGARRGPTEDDGGSRLTWKPGQAVRTFLGRPGLVHGYVTLAVVDADRRESQLGRLDATKAGEPPQKWVIRLVTSHMQTADDTRFRIRHWGPGGKAAGSVSFRVSKGERVPAPAGRPADSELLKRLTVMESAVDELRSHLRDLEMRLEAAEQAVQAHQPVVDAAQQALLILADSDDED